MSDNVSPSVDHPIHSAGALRVMTVADCERIHSERLELRALVERQAALLAEVEAERDRYRLAWFSARGGRLSVVGELHGLMYDNERLRARLAAVEALCMRSEWAEWPFAKKALAAARGEGD